MKAQWIAVVLAASAALSVPALAQVITQPVNQYFSGDSVLPLRQVLGLDDSYSGAVLESVTIVAESQGGMGSAQLLTDGAPAGFAQRVGGYSQAYTFSFQPGRDVLGSQIRSFDLRMAGNLFLQSVSVQIADDPDPGYPSSGDEIDLPFNRSYVGNNLLPLRQILNLGYAYSGRQIQYAMISARSANGDGLASLWVDGVQVGLAQRVGVADQQYFFELDPARNTLDQTARDVEIRIQGRFAVSAVGAKLAPAANPYPGPAPQPAVVSRVLNQNYSGLTELPLEDVLALIPAYDGRRVESVTIVATAPAPGGWARVFVNGQPQGGAQQVGDQLETHVFTLSLGGRLGSEIRSLGLELQGRFFVQSVSVTLSP